MRKVELYCNDCFKILPKLDKALTLVTDPPYIVEAGHGGGAFGCDKRPNRGKIAGFTDGGVDYGFLDSLKLDGILLQKATPRPVR